MMDHPLQMISYIADIESLVVLMVRKKPADHKTDLAACSPSPLKKCWMICHVFSSADVSFPTAYVLKFTDKREILIS